jgi:hypothetical protein
MTLLRKEDALSVVFDHVLYGMLIDFDVNGKHPPEKLSFLERLKITETDRDFALQFLVY